MPQIHKEWIRKEKRMSVSGMGQGLFREVYTISYPLTPASPVVFSQSVLWMQY
jgi:hypothetical protein